MGLRGNRFNRTKSTLLAIGLISASQIPETNHFSRHADPSNMGQEYSDAFKSIQLFAKKKLTLLPFLLENVGAPELNLPDGIQPRTEERTSNRLLKPYGHNYSGHYTAEINQDVLFLNSLQFVAVVSDCRTITF